MKRFRYVIVILTLILCAIILVACETQADVVSRNISQEADNFNVVRRLTVFNMRTGELMFTMQGKFSIEKEVDRDLAVIGENPDGTTYKHLVYMNQDTSYIVEMLTGIDVNKYAYEINFNPKMLLMPTVVPDIID